VVAMAMAMALLLLKQRFHDASEAPLLLLL
jgi:hypothetical protein